MWDCVYGETVPQTLTTTGSALAHRAASSIATAGASVGQATVERLAGSGVPAARAIGARPHDIRPHTRESPNLRDGQFANTEPADPGDDAGFGIFMDMVRRPGNPKSPVRVENPAFAPTPGEIAVHWLGHASALVELDGRRILTDPVFSRRCSPSQLVGPARMHPSPVTVADLPAIDVVLISHDHYDHLDMQTIIELGVRQPSARFVAPIGVGAHLQAWGIAADRISQADWWGTVELDLDGVPMTFACCPTRHFSGRWLIRNLTQWASWSVLGPRHRFFFSGDTGFTEKFDEVGDRYGPFDLTLIAVGAYDPVWPEIHVNPEEAVKVHRMLSGDAHRDAVMLPIHWGTFNLARHRWADPIERLLPYAQANATTVVVPPPGGFVDIAARAGSGLTDPDWWQASA